MNTQRLLQDGSEPTVTGNRGLMIEEGLIFEQDSPGQSGVDLPDAPDARTRLGGLSPRGGVGLPGMAEPQVVRHYTRLSQKNCSIDAGFYPLGSCTMKHNPRLNEKVARLPGFADVHPLQPESTVQGALELMAALGDWLKALTGMAAVTLTPAAGANGEMTGMMAIRAALRHHGEGRRVRVLVPESAHGTNPATAVAAGFTVDAVPAGPDGRIDAAAFEAKLGPDVAAIMLTNPNTCGLFERDIRRVADAVHAAGAYVYCDGANFNAIVGRVKPADLGVDAMHINLHKTFSTPHGGGGPGSGPVVFSEALAPYVPLPYVYVQDGRFHLVEDGGLAYGRMKAFHGQMGMLVRSLAYILSHGADGLRQASGDAVLSANYLLARLRGALSVPFEGPCMHECLLDDGSLKGTGVTTLDIAKALIDEGFHPMTVYFPLVVHGAMLIEPTESESKAELDRFADALLALVAKAKSGDAEWFHAAPRHTPRRRLDETAAARKPILRWKPE